MEALKPFAPGFTFVDTHAFQDVSHRDGGHPPIKPDIGMYSNDANARRLLARSITDLAEMDQHIEVKISAADYPFMRTTESAKDTLGQVASYAAAQQALQFRNHIFSVLICDSTATLIRWDRSGAIFSQRFPYLHEESQVKPFGSLQAPLMLIIRFGELIMTTRIQAPHSPPSISPPPLSTKDLNNSEDVTRISLV